VSSNAAKQRSRSAIPKRATRQPRRRLNCHQTKTRKQKRMVWNPQHRAKYFLGKRPPPPDQRIKNLLICLTITAELRRRKRDVSFQHHSRTVIQGMSQGCRRVNPLQSVLGEWQLLEEGRRNSERMDRRPEIVQESWQR
jgi:hypothetical protein